MDDNFTMELKRVFGIGDTPQPAKSPLKGTHFQKKGVIKGRLQVARVLIQRYYRERQKEGMSEEEFQESIERVIDNQLARHSYDIEYIIDKWREIAPPVKEYKEVCSHCGYRPPFCGFQWNDDTCSHKEKYETKTD